MCSFQCVMGLAHYTVGDVQLDILVGCEVDHPLCNKIVHSFYFKTSDVLMENLNSLVGM